MKKTLFLICTLLITIMCLPVTASAKTDIDLTFSPNSISDYYPGHTSSNSLTILANSEFFSISISHPDNQSYFMGLGVGFTKDELPTYTPYEEPSGNYLGKRNKSNKIEFFGGQRFRATPNFTFDFALGITRQEKVDLYIESSNTYLGKEKSYYTLDYHGYFKYRFTHRHKITFGYHSRHGALLGIKFHY